LRTRRFSCCSLYVRNFAIRGDPFRLYFAEPKKVMQASATILVRLIHLLSDCDKFGGDPRCIALTKKVGLAN